MSIWHTLRTRYRSSRALRWTVELAVLAIAVLAIGLFQTRDHPRGVAPDLALHELDGSPKRFAALAGKPTLLAVWAPWCGVCKLTTPNVAHARDWLGAGSQVVSVAASFESVDAVRAYV